METTYNLEFETRCCSNEGCNKTFKVLKTSKQQRCSLNCAHGPAVLATDFVRRPEQKKPPVNLKLIQEKDRTEALMQTAKAAPPKPKPEIPVVVEVTPPPEIEKDLKKEWDALLS